MTEDEWVHGPKTERDWRTCAQCNFDTHTCPGCGEYLNHGTGVCGPCRVEHFGETKPTSFEEEH